MRTRLTLALALLAVPAFAATVSAQAPKVRYSLQGATLPKPFLDGKAPNVVVEASGVEPIGDGKQLLVAHDKATPLHVVDIKTGKFVGEPIASPKFPATSKTGPKWEGMARDSEGNFYLIGAHNGKTEAEKATKRDLIRFRLKESGSPSIDDASVVKWSIDRSLVAALKGAGLTEEQVGKRKIEGLAIREAKGADGKVTARHLAIGLREPGDKVRGFVADITNNPSADAELELKPLFAFTSDPREGVSSNLTSLEYSQELGGFLAVTASEDEENAFHGNTLWFVADGSSDKAIKVGTFEVAMKAEGLAVLGAEPEKDGRLVVHLLITYDNDPHATHIPSRFQTVNLVRQPAAPARAAAK